MKQTFTFTFCAALIVALLFRPTMAESTTDARVVQYYGYDDCIRIENRKTRVTLCPAAGGRVLEYARDGENTLYLPAGQEGWIYEPGDELWWLHAGRCDIGPEQVIAKHPQLFMGRWQGQITGPRSARLTSVKDEPTGVQLIREFTLDEKSTRLECKQTIKNVSQRVTEYCFWSRTFVPGYGICVIPLTEPSRFPKRYVMYEPGALLNISPTDPNVRVRDGFLEVMGAPKHPKLGMDSYAGWLAYLMKNDVMFVKQFPTYRDRVYNEVAGLTISIWYPTDRPMCELEPIGPREKLGPGQSASFTETWWLLPHKFPAEGVQVDLKSITETVLANFE